MASFTNDITTDPQMSRLIATSCPAFNPMQVPQFEHRLKLHQNLHIKPGSHVLEIGCGQGDATVVLADAVGEQGQVTAVDPAPLDYGSPYTLGQAQAHIKSVAPLGSRITFVQADPTEYVQGLNSNTGSTLPDTAILMHSLYYFSSRAQIAELFSTLAKSPSIKTLLIAEWALIASEKSQEPHVIVAKIQGIISSAKDPKNNTANIRTLVSPEEIAALAHEAGWKIEKQGTYTPDLRLQDGRWEVSSVFSPGFLNKVKDIFGDDSSKQDDKKKVLEMNDELITKLRDLDVLEENIGKPGNLKPVKCMDTWWAAFQKP